MNNNNTNQAGEFYVALENLRASIEDKIDKVDTRQREDLRSLETKNDKFQQEVRDDLSDVKSRLTVIETQTADKDKSKKWNIEKLGTWAAIGILTFGMFKFYYNINANHETAVADRQQLVAKVEANHEDTKETIEEVARKAVEAAAKAERAEAAKKTP